MPVGAGENAIANLDHGQPGPLSQHSIEVRGHLGEVGYSKPPHGPAQRRHVGDERVQGSVRDVVGIHPAQL